MTEECNWRLGSEAAVLDLPPMSKRIIAVVGGTGTLAGSMLGAFILVPLSELLRGIGGLRIVIYGIFLVLFIVVLPEGIFHYIQRKYHQFERWVEVEK